MGISDIVIHIKLGIENNGGVAEWSMTYLGIIKGVKGSRNME